MKRDSVTPVLRCGRTSCRVAHDWVGGRCPGNAEAPVVDAGKHAAMIRTALHGGGR